MYDYNCFNSITCNLLECGYQQQNTDYVDIRIFQKNEKVIVLMEERIIKYSDNIIQEIWDHFLIKYGNILGREQYIQNEFYIISTEKRIKRRIKKMPVIIVNPENYQVKCLTSNSTETCMRIQKFLGNKCKQIQYADWCDNKYVGRTTFVVLIALVINCFLWYFININGLGDCKILSISSKSVFIEKEWWRCLTYMFCHKSIFHLIGNSIVLYCVGIPVCKRIGGFWFAICYVTCGLYGGVASAVWKCITHNAQDTVGASAAIFGIIAIWAIIDQDWMDNKKIMVKRLSYSILLLIINSILPSIDRVSHVGGFMTGLICAGSILLFERTMTYWKQYWLLKDTERMGYQNAEEDMDIYFYNGNRCGVWQK